MRLATHSTALARRSAVLALAPIGASAILLLAATPPSPLAFTGAGHARSASSSQGAGAGGASATLEQCVTSVNQTERSATFAGEMVATPGAIRMSIQIDLQERRPGEALFHAVVAPGLDVWRGSDPRVRIYKYLKQVTNLSSPAAYRALVRFRWLGARGHVIRRGERFTPPCEEPASPPGAGLEAATPLALSAPGEAPAPLGG